MKKVRIKTSSRFPTKWVVIIVLLFLLIGAAIYFVSLSQPQSVPIPQSEPDTKVLLFKGEKDDLASFTVKPSDGNEYTIIQKNSVYSIKDHPEYQLNYSIIDEMVDSLLYMEAEGLDFKINQTNINEFGLGEDAIEVSAAFKNNISYSFKIGSRILTDIPKDYGSFNTENIMYAYSITLRDIFDQQMNWLHIIPNINFTPDLLEQIRFDEDNYQLVLSRQAQGLWTMEEPYSYPVDEIKMQRLLDSIGKMRLSSFVDGANEKTISQYGLDNPRLTISFFLAPSIITSTSNIDGEQISQSVDKQKIDLQIGDSIAGIGFYCRYLDTIYQASDLSMGFLLDTSAAYYMSSLPMNIPLHMIDTISITEADGFEHAYTVLLVEHVLANNLIAKDSQGNTLYDFVITSNDGTEVSSEKFARMYSNLMSTVAIGTLDSFAVPTDNQPIMQILLDYKGFQRLIQFYPLDALHAAMGVNGNFYNYTDLGTLRKIEAQLSLLKD